MTTALAPALQDSRSTTQHRALASPEAMVLRAARPEVAAKPEGACACGGGCPRCEPAPLMPKLAVSSPGDPYELEADRVTDTVMRTPAPEAVGLEASTALQRCGSTPADLCPCHDAPPVVGEVLRSAGRPLDAATRAFVEPRFGRDFGDVRVHTDERAAESASAVDALAYTVGSNVVFGAGQYAPGTSGGQRLLAHELAHVVQQGAGAAPRISRMGDVSQIPPGLSCSVPDSAPGGTTTDVKFDRGSAVLLPPATTAIGGFITSWKADGGKARVRVDGYASTEGEDALNWRLSCQRALAVAGELTAPRSGALGVPSTFVDLFMQGETDEFSATSLGANRSATISADLSVPAPVVPVAPVIEPTCGPDISVPLASVLADVRSTFSGWSPTQRRDACDSITGPSAYAMAWDIKQLFLPKTLWLCQLPYHGPCGRPPDLTCADEDPTDCGNSVEVHGMCFLAGTVNYALFGQICRLCNDDGLGLSESTMEFLITSYKALGFALGFGYDDPGPPTAWARAGFHGFPGHIPTHANREHCRGRCSVPYVSGPFDWVWEPHKPR